MKLKTLLIAAALSVPLATLAGELKPAKPGKIYDYQQSIAAEVPFSTLVRQALGIAAKKSESSLACWSQLNAGPIQFSGEVLITKSGKIANSSIMKAAIASIGTRVVCAQALGNNVKQLQAVALKSTGKIAEQIAQDLAEVIANNMGRWNDAAIAQFDSIGIDILGERVVDQMTNQDADLLPWPYQIIVTNQNAGSQRPYSAFAKYGVSFGEPGRSAPRRLDLEEQQGRWAYFAQGGIFEARTMGLGEFVAEIKPAATDGFVVSRNGAPWWDSQHVGGRNLKLSVSTTGKTQFEGQ